RPQCQIRLKAMFGLTHTTRCFTLTIECFSITWPDLSGLLSRQGGRLSLSRPSHTERAFFQVYRPTAWIWAQLLSRADISPLMLLTHPLHSSSTASSIRHGLWMASATSFRERERLQRRATPALPFSGKVHIFCGSGITHKLQFKTKSSATN